MQYSLKLKIAKLNYYDILALRAQDMTLNLRLILTLVHTNINSTCFGLRK